MSQSSDTLAHSFLRKDVYSKQERGEARGWTEAKIKEKLEQFAG